jgi:succinate dehydrogenase/fumarate reductase cytochrome b subunit
MSREENLIFVQQASGVAFSTFLGLHLTNHLATHFGFMFADGVRRVFQVYYQNPVVEITCVFGAAAVHAVVGLIRWNDRRKLHTKLLKERTDANEPPKEIATPLELQVHRNTGRVLSIFYVGHVLATRVIPYFYKLDAGYFGPYLTLVYYPQYFAPYYWLFTVAGVYHTIYGLSRALTYFKVFPGKNLLLKRRGFNWVMAGASIFALSVVLAVGGVYFDHGVDPASLIREYENILGVQLVAEK